MFVNSADFQTDQLGDEVGVGGACKTEQVVLMSGPPMDLVLNHRACSFTHKQWFIGLDTIIVKKKKKVLYTGTFVICCHCYRMLPLL